MIADVSLITGEPMPSAVYLVPDANAYVANRAEFWDSEANGSWASACR
jgi:hypothetical protein